MANRAKIGNTCICEGHLFLNHWHNFCICHAVEHLPCVGWFRGHLWPGYTKEIKNGTNGFPSLTLRMFGLVKTCWCPINGAVVLVNNPANNVKQLEKC